MANHTKTPWRVVRQNEIDDKRKIVNTVYGIAAGKIEGPFENTGFEPPDDPVYYQHEHYVVEIGCDRDYHTPEAAIANREDAEFICLAVNNHDDLVLALEKIADLSDFHGHPHEIAREALEHLRLASPCVDSEVPRG